MEKELIIDESQRFVLTTLVNFLNDCGQKKNSRPFNAQDVEGYISRGCFPPYIKPGYKILIMRSNDIPGVKMYRLKEVKL